jgi:hypothetical protein
MRVPHRKGFRVRKLFDLLTVVHALFRDWRSRSEQGHKKKKQGESPAEDSSSQP